MTQREGSQETEEGQLVEQALAGSQSAFRKLYDRYQKKIYRLVGSMVNSPEDVDDIVQGIFIRAFRSLESFKKQSSFYTWLYRIALNATTDFRRKDLKLRQRVSDKPLSELEQGAAQFTAPLDGGPEEELYRKEIAQLVGKTLDTLSVEHRQVLILRELEGLSYAEIAQMTGASIGTVMSRLHYARKNLAATLDYWNVLEMES